jgi:arsenate reductase (thioredoxin)
MNKPLNVLFLCTHNSARSILAEALTNHLGGGTFRGFSAGSSPRENGGPNPLGLQVLREQGISTEGLRSKSWDEFAGEGAPKMDLIITVCDNAAGEVCPLYNVAPREGGAGPSNPARAHWGYPDPSAGEGTDAEKLAAFKHTLHAMRRRIELLINLPPEKLEASSLQASAKALASA